MSSLLSAKQTLILWNLLITGDQPKMSEVKPKLSPVERKLLLDAGLIRLEKRGRSSHIILEDKAWDWAVENFDVRLSRSNYAVPVLEVLLIKLGHYINTHQVSLAEVLTASEIINPLDESTFEDADSNQANNLSTDDLIEKVRQTYFSIPDGAAGFRVRLHELREHLPELSKQQINQLLLDLQSRGEVSLRRAEDLQELNTDDEAAAIDMGDGDRRYFVRMKR